VALRNTGSADRKPDERASASSDQGAAGGIRHLLLAGEWIRRAGGEHGGGRDDGDGFPFHGELPSGATCASMPASSTNRRRKKRSGKEKWQSAHDASQEVIRCDRSSSSCAAGPARKPGTW